MPTPCGAKRYGIFRTPHHAEKHCLLRSYYHARCGNCNHFSYKRRTNHELFACAFTQSIASTTASTKSSSRSSSISML